MCHIYSSAKALTTASAIPAAPKRTLFCPAPLDPVALGVALALLASALNLLAAEPTAAVLLDRRLLIVWLAPVAVAVRLLTPLPNAVIEPVAFDVSKVRLSRVSEGLALDGDGDALALALPERLPDCVMVMVFMFEIVFVCVTVLAESCARTMVARADVRRVEARMVTTCSVSMAAGTKGRVRRTVGTVNICTGLRTCSERIAR